MQGTTPVDRRTNIREIMEARLPPDTAGLIKKLGEAAAAAGLKAFITGGFVRDLMLGVPVGDIDLAVEGPAGKFAEDVAGILGGKLLVHDRFKTATVFLGKGARIDVSAAREERYDRPAALPRVVSSSIYNDLFRRDFTVNALAVSISPGTSGELIDCFGGLEDLGGGIIRVLHEKSFEDDPTRVFRAVRFAHRLGFEIEAGTKRLMAAAAAGRFCENLTGARLRNEIELLFKERNPAAAAAMMRAHGIHICIHPRASLTPRKIKAIEKLQDIIPAAEETESLRGTAPWLAYFMCALKGMDGDSLACLSKRLMLGRGEARALKSLPLADSLLKEINSVETMPCSEVYSLAGRAPREAVIVALSEAGAEQAAAFMRKLGRAERRKAETTGSDLLKMGFPQGPVIERVLAEVSRARMDGRLESKEEELDYIKKRFSPGA